MKRIRMPIGCAVAVSKGLPEVSIYAAYSAGAVIATRVTVPDVVPANKIKALAGHEKTAYVFAALGKHQFDKKCPCYVCDNTPTKEGAFNPFKRASWQQGEPVRPYVRFDIGARNVRLKVRGGEHFVVVAECDIDEWLSTLPLNLGDRLGLMLALPLTIERAATKSKREDGVD